MNAGSPTVVVHSSCLSPSTCNSTTRQGLASYVGLPYSPVRRLSPAECALSLSSAAANMGFFHIPHRRRKHSPKFVFVVQGSRSTFEFDEARKRQGLQTAGFARERLEHATQGRVSWSPDGKATILWATQKQQDKASSLHEKRQLSGAQNKKADELSEKFSSRHGPPVPSVGEHKNWQNQQRDSPLARTSPQRHSLPSRQQSELFNPSSASRLLIGSPAFKEAAETDTLGSPDSSVKGEAKSLTRNEYIQIQGGACIQKSPHCKEDTSQDESVFTSKLEEILNNFRTSQRREEVWRERTRQKSQDDQGAALSEHLGLTSEVGRKRSNINTRQSWRSSTQDFQSTNDRCFIHKTAANDVDVSKESFATTEGHQTFPRKGSFTMGQQNIRGNSIDLETLDSIDASSLATPLRAESRHLPISQMLSPVRKGSATFVERRAVKSDALQYNSRNSFSESKAKGWGIRNKKSFIRGKYTERPYTSRTNQDLHVQKPVDLKLDVDVEDCVDIASPITSDSEEHGSYSTPSEKAKEQKRASSVGFKASEHEPSKKKEKPCWQSHSIPALPFKIQYSYSEAPNAPIIRHREEPYSPFGPRTLSRPWTGGPPKKKSKKNLPLFDSFNPPPKGMKGIKHVQDPGPYREGQGPKPAKSRDAILGEPLTAQEIAELIEVCYNEKRQLNLGRDGLTHNMLDLIHTHWKRRRVIKVRCLGVPTVDMDNVCFHLEDKTGGTIIFRSGGNVYLFRGRNYNYKDRPEIPLMLWKPIAPVYPKLIKRAPEGLTEEEAYQLRLLGKKVEPLCTLRKNGIYLTLVNDVRAAFKSDKLVRIDCRGLNPSDYKKIGAKLKDLVPCVLLSFDDEQILMWRGKETPIDVNSLKGSETAEGFIKKSSMSRVESTSASMNDLKAGVSANVSRAERNLSSPGTEEIQHASSSLKSFNNHPIALGSAHGEVENATIDSLPTSSWSLDNEHASDVIGATPHMSHPELSHEDFMERDCMTSGEANSSLHIVLPAQDELDLDEPDVVFQNTILQKKNNINGRTKEREVLPGATCIEERQFTESSLLTEGQDRELATLQAALALESRSASLDCEENVGTAENTCIAVGVDGLWDQAITSGIAIKLDDVEIDNDIVMKKAIELAKAFPAVEVYSRKLMRELEPKTRKVFKPENEVHKHLKKIRKMKLEKKLSKRPFRVRTADVPKDLPQDGTRNSGMPVDELARLLSMR